MKRKIIAAVLIAGILLACFGIVSKHFAYIVHYNNGNRYYRQYSYGKAIEQYGKALEQVIPEGKECRIRINLALAMLGLLGPDYAQPEQIENSIMVLEEARWELLAQDCATDAGTGHSEEAEQLKEEIDKMLKQLYHNDLISRYVCRILTSFTVRRSGMLNEDNISVLYSYMDADKQLGLFSVRPGQIVNILLYKP